MSQANKCNVARLDPRKSNFTRARCNLPRVVALGKEGGGPDVRWVVFAGVAARAPCARSICGSVRKIAAIVYAPREKVLSSYQALRSLSDIKIPESVFRTAFQGAY